MIKQIINTYKTIHNHAWNFHLLKMISLTFRTQFFNKMVKTYIAPSFPQSYKQYLKPILPTLQPQISQLISSMPKTPKNVLAKTLSRFLNIQNNKLSPLSFSHLLLAIDNINDSALSHYKYRALQFILRNPDLHLLIMDYRCMDCFIKNALEYENLTHQRIKNNVIKYKTAQLFKINIQRILPYNYRNIMMMLVNFTQGREIAKISRYISCARMMQEKLKIFISRFLQKKLTEKQADLFNPSFVNECIQFYRHYHTSNQQQTQLLYDLLLKVYSLPQFTKNINTFYLANSYRYFSYEGKDSQGVYLKDRVLQFVIQKFKNMKNIEEWHYSFLCYAIISFQFYKAIEKMQFRQQGDHNYLPRDQLNTPILPQFFWQIYKQKTNTLNKIQITRNIIKDCYTDRFIDSPVDPDWTTMIPPANAQNQIKTRVDMALQRLKIVRKKQLQISGRFADFLIGDVILQIDGDYHFNLNKMDYNEQTQFRNMHFLLAGYRLVLVNVFQYNEHRSVDKLAALIKAKFQVLQRTKAIMVV